MALSRETSLRIRWFLDSCLPPVLRDSPLVMYPLLRIVFGRRWRTFAAFKERGFGMSEEEFAKTYATVADLADLQGGTDLNDRCLEAILETVSGSRVLDVGCGRGLLATRLAEVIPEVVGCDIVLDAALGDQEGLSFVEGSAEAIPFPDASFDTVVCTHTLEHVQRIDLALAELRRVTAKRLIVVVPRERPYRYSFNLHLHFFPYPWSWTAVAGASRNGQLTDLGDWFYVEDVS